MKQHAIITGAGTGVGRHTAIALAKAGWALTLNGRTLSTLEETQKSCQAHGSRCHIVAGSIAERGFAARLIQEAIQTHGAVGMLCNAAGTNTPRRMLEELSEEDYHRLIDTNLHGSYDAIQAILPRCGKRAQEPSSTSFQTPHFGACLWQGQPTRSPNLVCAV